MTRKAKLVRLQAVIDTDKEGAADVLIDAAELANQMDLRDDGIATDSPVKPLDNNVKKRWDSKWKAHGIMLAVLVKHRGNVFAMIKGQCNQVLIDRMA